VYPISSRRQFLTTAAGTTVLGLGDLSILTRLGSVSAAEAHLDINLVRLQPDIEPLVRFIEETPRGQLIEETAARVRSGLPYRDLLAALLLAGVRGIQPRPNVGFKFHAVLVVNSAHLASLAAPDSERWLPIFWALDQFKSSQATNEKESGWRMRPVDEAKVPSARTAKQAFTTAMDRWDEEVADAAAAGIARTLGANEALELFVRFGARDFRDIGHKAIYVANSWRTLQCIGWRHAEPVLRSLAYALLKYDGGNPADRDDPADRPGRRNRELAERFGPDWQGGAENNDVTADLLAMLRQAKPAEADDKILQVVNVGLAPRSVWNAIHVGAAELLARQPGIVALHTVTSVNALSYAYETVADDALRRYLLLQAAAFVTLFREAVRGRGKLSDLKLDALEPADVKLQGTDAVSAILRDMGSDRSLAARKFLAYRAAGGDPAPLMDAARLLVFAKGTDSHDYKFSSAVLEDYARVSPAWRDRYLAAALFQLRAPSDPDTALLKRMRAALKG
jgi:hypothetical protein